jgi:transcriptional regulator with XRE-family HTH domain
MGLVNRQASFGYRLKRRRQTLGLSQLQLATEAGVSPRHISFIETGRSSPSRDMVLRLAAQLRVPLREQNALLLAAGFAPVFAQRDLDSAEMAAVRDAAALVLANHDPFPAVAIDRNRNVVTANRGSRLLFEGVSSTLLEPPINVYRLILHPDGVAGRIVNFGDYSGHLVARLRRDAEMSGDDALADLLDEVSTYPGVRPSRCLAPVTGDVALSLRLRDATDQLAFIATIATFGTPFDVTVAELVIESLFPADAHTAARLRARDAIAQARGATSDDNP